MKKNLWYLFGSAVVLTGLVFLLAQCETDASEMAQLETMAATAGDRDAANGQVADICQCLMTQFPNETLSGSESNALLYMREEEKLARDVYTVLLGKWGAQVFSNISGAEQRHMDAVGCLIQKYKLNDPVGNNGAGVFQNANLQALYTALVNQGAQSLPAALAVGAKIEDLDIADLLKAVPEVNNADVLAVFNELTKGSRNHLRAFANALEMNKSTYKPEFISQQQFDDIIGTPHERGGSICGTCPNPNNPGCKGAGKGPNGIKGCPGMGPNGGNNCTGPNGPQGCTGAGPNGTKKCNGTGPNGSGGNGNGNGGNGNGPKGNGGNGNGNGGGN